MRVVEKKHFFSLSSVSKLKSRTKLCNQINAISKSVLIRYLCVRCKKPIIRNSKSKNKNISYTDI